MIKFTRNRAIINDLYNVTGYETRKYKNAVCRTQKSDKAGNLHGGIFFFFPDKHVYIKTETCYEPVQNCVGKVIYNNKNKGGYVASVKKICGGIRKKAQ